MIHKHRILIPDVVVFLFIFVVAIFLFVHIDYFPAPNSDVFQYIGDGQKYLSGQLPHSIQSPPANPILISLLSRVINHPYPEIISAISINIISSTAGLFLLWILAKKYLDYWAMAPVILVLTNPIFYLVSLHPTSEVLFTTLAILILIFILEKRIPLAYILTAITYFVRYEAIIFLPIIFLMDTRRLARKHLVWGSIAGAIILGWTLLVIGQNDQGNVMGNAFVQEMFFRNKEIPNFRIFSQYPGLILFNTPVSYQLYKTLLYGLMFLIIVLAWLQKKSLVQALVLYMIGYLVVHIFFPDSAMRYVFPILPILYLSISWFFVWVSRFSSGKTKLLVGVCIFSLFVYVSARNMAAGQSFIPPLRDGAQYQLLAKWLNTNPLEGEIKTVITLEPWIANYYLRDNTVWLQSPMSDTFDCESLICVCQKVLEQGESDTVYVVKSSDTVNNYNPISKMFGVDLFQIDFRNTPSFRLVGHHADGPDWVEIYQYIGNQADQG